MTGREKWSKLMNEMASLDREGAYSAAIAKGEAALALIDGLSAKEKATTLNNLAGLYKSQGLYERAEPLYLRALAISEALGKNHPDVATILNGLAGLYQSQGLYERAVPFCLRALAINEALGKNHLHVATTLNNLAVLYESQGLYERAVPLCLRALAISEAAQGKDHPGVAAILDNLAGLYESQGLYDQAVSHCLRALRIRETLLGRNHPNVANSLNNLAGLYQRQGLYERAEPLYLRALSISEVALGEGHPHVATTLNNLAALYESQGSYERAVPLYLRALGIRETALGEGHPHVATTLNNLAALYESQGSYERAVPLYLRALRIRETVLGEGHPDVATTLNNLAALYESQGSYDRAEPLYLRALGIGETTLGKDHPRVANSLNNLALLHQRQGSYERAEPLYLRALRIRETVLGEDHPDVATTLNNLAGLYQSQGLYEQALAYFQASLERQYNFLCKRLAHISEQEHKLYLKDLKLALELLLSLVYHHLNTSSQAIEIALNTVLLTKNLSAAALAARNAIVHSGNPQLQPKLHQVRELLAQSNRLEYNDPQQAEIRNQIRAIEIEIARIAPEVMLPDVLEVDRQAIALKLPSESSLVEFIGFDVYDFDNKSWDSARYLAFVYSPDRSDEIQMADLGLAAEIDTLIDTCRKSILNLYNSVETAAPCIPDEIEEFSIESLEPTRARIIEPLHLNGVSHVIIAVDGELSFLPFQLFLPDCLVSYLNTGRDLVRTPSQKPAGDSIVIADPDFANTPTELHLVASKPQLQSDRLLVARLEDLNNWRSLTSFGILGKAIANKLKVPCYKQRSAAKARLTQSQCPHVLSILTHGFSLPKTDAEELDPMARSGLAFAGANHGAEYLLLANEVATLDLHNNELTLLVACQTALGDATAGEGVYGLRRAFALAGAKTLIATLWEIPVYASVILIERFIDNLERYMGKAAALKEAQMYLRDLTVATLDTMPAGKTALAELHGSNYHLQLDRSLQPFSHPFFWAAWICQGDTGAMGYVIAKNIGKYSIDGKIVNLRIRK